MASLLCWLGGHNRPSREPWREEARTEWREVERGRAKGFVYFNSEYRCQRCGEWQDGHSVRARIDYGATAIPPIKPPSSLTATWEWKA